jgi:hypothetical protein
MDTLDSLTVAHGYTATKNGRPQHQERETSTVGWSALSIGSARCCIEKRWGYEVFRASSGPYPMAGSIISEVQPDDSSTTVLRFVYTYRITLGPYSLLNAAVVRCLTLPVWDVVCWKGDSNLQYEEQDRYEVCKRFVAFGEEYIQELLPVQIM